jgi:phage host-nuclease inhibitor protein Gam
MARKRFDDPVLKSWDEVDLHMKEVGEIDLELLNVEGKMNQKISDAKLEAELEVKPLKDRKERLAREVKDFVENHRVEINGKTKRMNFGQLGFRQSTKVVIPKDQAKVQAIIAALKAKNMLDCVNTKEDVNKDILRTYSDEVIAAVGARKKVEDVFWLEPDYEKIK